MIDESLRPSPDAEAILRTAGWSPDREVDTSGWVDMLRRDDNEVFPHAKAILKSFGGLRLEHEGFGGISSQGFQIDPASWYYERERISDIEEIIGHKVCPLGEAFGAAMLAVLDNEGVISEFEGSVVLLGNNWRAALDYLLLDRGTTIRLAEDYEPIDHSPLT